ncbi:hypothetical protein E2C01_003363 [Portunus trituberculatus]|uniref:Uncharacterized protein n=1 Tax=Portunus trituberculatus TaxID=210409 RepID=A0A5B7CTD0_PORTR|nr:hypothetical protein [Portunus trituberculatus]
MPYEYCTHPATLHSLHHLAVLSTLLTVSIPLHFLTLPRGSSLLSSEASLNIIKDLSLPRIIAGALEFVPPS